MTSTPRRLVSTWARRPPGIVAGYFDGGGPTLPRGLRSSPRTRVSFERFCQERLSPNGLEIVQILHSRGGGITTGIDVELDLGS